MRFFVLGFVSFMRVWLTPGLASAESVNPFPTIVPNSIEDSACYFKMSNGQTIALNSICGYSTPISEKQAKPTVNDASAPTPSPIVNPEFRPIAGSNPGNPFGRNSGNNDQCYVVDSDGNSCR
jgi:hypothetical protein